MATTRKATMVLLLVALLPLSTVSSSRAGPSSAHRSHGGGGGSGKKHNSPPPSSSSPPPPPAPAPVAALVRATCNSTTYPDLCVSTLSADPSSATADVRGLSAIAVSAAATNASGGAAAATALAASVNANTTEAQAPSGSAAAGDDATVQALLRTCAGKYGEARDALAAARGSIAAQDYDSASVHVSAAAEYPQVCRVLFQRQRPGAYPAELAAREVALRQLCTVALDIITILSNNSN